MAEMRHQPDVNVTRVQIMKTKPALNPISDQRNK